MRHLEHTLIAMTLLAAAGSACAHGGAPDAIPEDAGLRLNMALAISQASAPDAWPAARLPGILGAGNTPVDRRGTALEHATAEVGVRLTPWLGAALALGWHDSDPAHVEAAWLRTDHELGDDTVQLGAGRNRLPMGQLLEGGGHFDRFAAMPLAKRAVLDDDWIDDGVSLRWQRSHDATWSWLQAVDIGLWRAQAFPGGAGAPMAPAIHISLGWSALSLDGFASTVRPRQRGAHLQNAQAAHTHDKPDCQGSLTGIFCFDGRSDVLAGSATWRLPFAGLQLESAALLRRDRGVLSSSNGDATYSGTTAGGWTDMVWPVTPRITLALRRESVRGVQDVQGSSALPVARDAGLTGSTRIWRAAAAASYAPVNSLKLSLEAGTDRQGSTRNDFVVLRLLWLPDTLWGASW